jgi:hypothetical protein
MFSPPMIDRPEDLKFNERVKFKTKTHLFFFAIQATCTPKCTIQRTALQLIMFQYFDKFQKVLRSFKPYCSIMSGERQTNVDVFSDMFSDLNFEVGRRRHQLQII